MYRVSKDRSAYCRGMVTALFAGVVLPLVFIMFTVTVELSQFFGIREEVQQSLDREAHDVLRFSRLTEGVEDSLRRQLGSVGDVVMVRDVAVVRDARQAVVSAQLDYNGVFLPLVEGLFGMQPGLLSMRVESQAQVQTNAALVVLDRSVMPGDDSCSSDSLTSRQIFVDTLLAQWADITTGGLSVAVFPGENEPVERVFEDGSDEISRCGARDTGRVIDAQSIMGASNVAFDAYDVAFSMLSLVGRALVEQTVAKRVVIMVMSGERYAEGYAGATANILQQATNGTPIPIDLVTIVVDDTGEIQYRPSGMGIHGGMYREIGASQSELQGGLLPSTVAQLISGNVVLER
jgi:hypothetical protein